MRLIHFFKQASVGLRCRKGQAFVMGFLGLLVISSLLFPQTSFAWSTKSARSGSQKIKLLSKTKRKRIAANAAMRLFRSEFIKDAGLPRKIALAKIYVEGEDLNTSSEEFTDLYLNEIFDHPYILVVNQDVTTDLSLAYKLIDYYPEYEARKQGVLLGANYYISGTFRSEPYTKESGKVEQRYVFDYTLRNIRNNKVIVHVNYVHGQKKTKRKKK
ncbi:MAG: hypothetical protein H7A33_07565 [Deltaproteobacteria bacterium]|nr:hypothetical protein [Deltaproteobacteria bacterium]